MIGNILPKSGATYFKASEFKNIEVSDKLLTPSIFEINDLFTLNINNISAEIGPFIAGIDISPLQIRILNFTQQQITCVFKQIDIYLPLPTFENKNGFLFIVIPIDKANISLAESNDLLFKGDILFSKESNDSLTNSADEPFAKIPYSILLHYIPPIIKIKINNHFIATKDGKAEIVPFACFGGDILEIGKLTSIDTSLNIVELPENSACKPKEEQIKDQYNITGWKIKILEGNKDERHFAVKFDFGINLNLPISIPCILDIKEPIFDIFQFCEQSKQFIQNDALINIGNLWRKIYIFIRYFNPLNQSVSPIFVITSKNKSIETRTNESSKEDSFDENKYQGKLFYFEARTIDKIDRNEDNRVQIVIKIGTINKTIQFKIDPNFVVISKKEGNTLIFNPHYPLSLMDENNEFVKFNKSQHNESMKKLPSIILVTPFAFFFQNNINNKYFIKYNNIGEIISSYYGQKNSTKLKFEFLVFDNEGNIKTIKKYNIGKSEKYLKLFGRIENKPETFFPLFGHCFHNNNNFVPNINSPIDQNQNQLLEWYIGFLNEDDKKNLPQMGNDLNFDIFFNGHTPSTHNFGYLINFLGKILNKVKYAKIGKEITKFIGNNFYEIQYANIYNKNNNLEWKFISLIAALHITMQQKYSYLRSQLFCIDLPIPFDIIIKEQDRLIEEVYLDEGSLRKQTIFIQNNNKSNYENKVFEKQKQKEYLNKGYKISNTVKWTLKDGFTFLTEREEKDSDYSNMKKTIYDIKVSTNSKVSSYQVEMKTQSFESIKSIESACNAFDSVLNSTYQFTCLLYNALKLKRNFNNFAKILNQIVSVYDWSKESQKTTPYILFLNNFVPAYSSMVNRLKAANLNIQDIYLVDKIGKNLNRKEDQNGENINENDFIFFPSSKKITMNLVKWEQQGKAKEDGKINLVGPEETVNQENNKPGKEAGKLTKNKDSQQTNGQDPVKPHRIIKGRIISPSSSSGGNSRNIKIQAIKETRIIVKPITADINNEVSNSDYMKDMLTKMVSPNEDEMINDYSTDKSHIPDKLRVHKKITLDILKQFRINPFFKAAKAMSNSLVHCFDKNDTILNNCDSCYASILIDSSSTFSEIHKASLITLAISYANSLTSLRIPYAIIIFCDQNYQFILKELEDQHDKINFQILLESMTVKRRMSSLSDALQIAKMKVKPVGKEISNRTNHLIYILTDGISTKFNIGTQWKQKILNDPKVAVSFFFLNILSEDDFKFVQGIWNKFAEVISNSISPSCVHYSTYPKIYEGCNSFCDSFISPILKIKNSNKISQPAVPSPSNCINTFISPKFAQNVKILSEDFLNKICSILSKKMFDEQKFYFQISCENEFEEILTIENPLIIIESFCVNFDEVSTYYEKFANSLFMLSEDLIDISSAQEMGTLVFTPNKPSQYTPSSNGTIFYFPGLIKFLLTQGQDNKIFLEKKAGLVRSYSVFVVIDCTTSCFNINSISHAYQSILSLLQSLYRIDLPSFNLIVTTKDGPVILSSEKSTISALDPSSPLWFSLFEHLSNPHPNSQLYSALLSVYSMRSQQKTTSSVLFIFTDGNYGKEQRCIFNSIFENISMYKVSILSIGIGCYPSNIRNLTQKAVWSINPRNLIRGILTVFGKEVNDFVQHIFTLYLNIKIDDEFVKILSLNMEYKSVNDENYIFKELIKELHHITRKIAVFQDFYNKRIGGNESIAIPSNDGTEIGGGKGKGKWKGKGSGDVIVKTDDLKNMKGNQYDMGKVNNYKGVKILICLFWDRTMTRGENSSISEKVLINGMEDDKDHTSVVNSLQLYGMEPKIVKNYIQAIHELTSGEYSQVWIICGRYDGKMPDKSECANIAPQFTEVVIKYWENGGGLVFWTDNYPLCAEVNMFLEKVEIEGKKVDFRIDGNDPGKSTLKPSKNLSASKCCFDINEMIVCDGYEKYLYNFGLNIIYEGITIASAVNKNNKKYSKPSQIAPFKCFSVSSSGGISSLYYNSPLESQCGDIVIDCGFSKLFFELKSEGIHRYVKNIAVFMLSLEKKESMFGGPQDPCSIKPPKFSYNIKKYAPPDPPFFQYNDKRGVDVVFMIDGTGSMRYVIEAVRDSCMSIAEKSRKNFPNNCFRFGAIIYRDDAVNEVRYGLKYQTDSIYFPLNQNDLKLKDFLFKIEAFGGGNDGPEDWVSGYEMALNMNWNEASEKIVIHIADAPGHGWEFCGDFKYPHFSSNTEKDHQEYDRMNNKHDEEFPKLVQQAARKGIMFACLNASRDSKIAFKKTRNIYNNEKGKMFTINDYYGGIGEEQKDTLLQIVEEIALQSVDSAVAVTQNDLKADENKENHQNQKSNNFATPNNNVLDAQQMFPHPKRKKRLTLFTKWDQPKGYPKQKRPPR